MHRNIWIIKLIRKIKKQKLKKEEKNTDKKEI